MEIVLRSPVFCLVESYSVGVGTQVTSIGINMALKLF